MNSSTVGSRTEGIVLAALIRQGRRILLPFGDGNPYDLALDEAGALVRVQCKTATYACGCVVFDTSSRRRDLTRVSYRGRVDMFGVYCPPLDTVYLVPVSDVGQREGRLRVEPARNNQASGIRWAQQYELK
jgi:hypothetical protein